MPTPRREVVLAAFKTQLAANIAGYYGAEVPVHRNRKDAITAAPAVCIQDGGYTTDDTNNAEDRITMRVKVYGYATGTKSGSTPAGEDLGANISNLDAAIVAAIMQDRTLGGVADDVRTPDMDDPDFDPDTGRQDNADIVVGFLVEYVTAPGNPFAAP